jgi:hypothetical protein
MIGSDNKFLDRHCRVGPDESLELTIARFRQRLSRA